MINVRNLSVSFGNDNVLKDVNIEFPSKGIVVLLGESGSGKTTLLNCLSGLQKYKGSINYDGLLLEGLGLTELNNFRLKNIGFVFQDFKLFNLDTVEHNISFPFDVLNLSSETSIKRRVEDLLLLVDMKNKQKSCVKNLSGGEKQRVAIARALVNDPAVILADEPTGALDENNALKIMSLIKSISKNKLVIIVSHDEELMSKYADYIVRLKDGVVSSNYKVKTQVAKENISLINNKRKKRRPYIPLRFLLRHTMQNAKEKKWRTILVNLITSLGLIGVGLASSISNSISTNIKEACANLLDSDQIVISQNEKNKITQVESCDEVEIKNLKSSYSNYIEDSGCIYQTDLNKLFVDENDFYICSNTTNFLLNGYNANHLNNFFWLDESEENFYPSKPQNMEDDEVVISLSVGAISNICFQLRIQRTVESFIEYFEENDIYLVLKTRNKNWQYYDEQLFKIIAFTLDYENKIYHINHYWNKVILEDTMRMVSKLNLSSIDYYPWTIKKLNYVKAKMDKRDEFLRLSRYDESLNEYLFEIGSKSYFPSLYKVDEEVKTIDRLIVFKNKNNGIPLRLKNTIDEVLPENNNVIFGSNGGYAVYKEAMLMGFSNFMYFSFDKKLLKETLEDYSNTNTQINQSVVLPHNVESGHFTKTIQNGVIFLQIPNNFKNNYISMSLDEIVISKGLYDSFTGNNKNIMTLAFTIKEEKLASGKILRDYRYVDLKVVGVINEEKKAIYHNENWLIDFFQTRLGVSIFNLSLSDVVIELQDGSDVSNALEKAKKAFPNYEVTNPSNSINEGIDSVCQKLEIVIFTVSSVAIIIAIFLLTICNYLHVLEIKRDIGLARCIGVSNIEATKFIIVHAFLLGILSFIISSFELIILNFVISKILSQEMGTKLLFSINPLSIFYMFIVSIAISLLSSLVISISLRKFSPLDALKIM